MMVGSSPISPSVSTPMRCAYYERRWPTVAITSKWCPTLYSAVRNRANTENVDCKIYFKVMLQHKIYKNWLRESHLWI